MLSAEPSRGQPLNVHLFPGKDPPVESMDHLHRLTQVLNA